MKFKVFVRSWWKSGRPFLGRKTILGFADTETAARDWCRVYNLNHNPGARGRKAEYMRVGV